MVTRHKFESITIRMRWIDFVRIKKVYPEFPNETAQSYFRRLAMWLKEQKK